MHYESGSARGKPPAFERPNEFVVEFTDQLARLCFDAEMALGGLAGIRGVDDGIAQAACPVAGFYRDPDVA